MAKFCLKNGDMYGVIDWATQAYNKWLDGRPKSVDKEELEYLFTSASMFTGKFYITHDNVSLTFYSS